MDNSLFSPCPRSGFSSPISSDTPADLYSKRNKRKASEDAAFSTPKISCCCHSTVGDLLKELETGKYGDVTKEMNDLYERRMASLKPFYKDLPKYPFVTKESIPKLWFEWNGVCRPEDFQLEKVDVTDCGDNFLETPSLHEDVLSLYRR